ncbi:hypothetical protein OX284_005070 [Flavobacterium sp. SUN046]|uniref:hypothetical protein n=1 Tax=Flavobacterium sp. SUN046 TaxID=3002440 RepID=UPI002DB9472B|nr:hypothetical protein [Flavobacterium sp. SUN046]MEC4048792.1 hypothetical protein [Flavobacterium sp. SUN046]
MKIIYSLALLLTIQLTQGQSVEQIDSLNIKICKSLEDNVHLKRDIRVDIINHKYITPFLKKYTDTIAQKEAFDRIFFRLQKNCNAFVVLLNQDEKTRNDWAMQSTAPENKLSKKQLKDFYSKTKYYYKEPNDKMVKVTFGKDLYEEVFEDGTYSKLSFVKGDNGSFDIYFIESNNETRKNLSVKGDVYHYQLFDAKDGIYSIYVQNKDVYYTFKLYPQE